MRFPKAKTLLPLLIAATALSRCSCDFFGTTGGLFISEADEEQMGKSFDSTLTLTDSGKTEFPVFAAKSADSLALQTYVIGLANEVLTSIPKTERPGYPFKFTLIDKDVENAFAVPGGYVYIYTGIIKKMQDESELVGVLGHEIAHVTQHHYRDAMAKSAAFSLILQALVGDDSKLGQLIGGSLFTLARLQVSQSNESEADFYGTKYEGNTGRNPMGIAKFFSRFEGQGIGSWVSTHPDPPDRVNAVADEVKKSSKLNSLAADSATTNFKTRFEQATAVLKK